MSMVIFTKARQKARDRIMKLVVSYYRKWYPAAFSGDLNLQLYDEFEMWSVMHHGNRFVGGVMIRQTGERAEIHVLTSPSLIRNPKAVDDFLAFLQLISSERKIKHWDTLVRTDNHAVREAMIHLGFTATTNNTQFIEYSKEGIAC